MAFAAGTRTATGRRRPRPGVAWVAPAALLAATVASAQPAAAPASATSATSATSPTPPTTVVPAVPAASAPRAGVPEIERRVIEDDGVRIEEVRVRGQVQSIQVQSKVGNVRAYEIVVGRGGRDPSQDKSAAGQRVWSLLRF